MSGSNHPRGAFEVREAGITAMAQLAEARSTAGAPAEDASGLLSSISASSLSLGDSVAEAAIADVLQASSAGQDRQASAAQTAPHRPSHSQASVQASGPLAATSSSSMQTEPAQPTQIFQQTVLQPKEKAGVQQQAPVQTTPKGEAQHSSRVQTDAPRTTGRETAVQTWQGPAVAHTAAQAAIIGAVALQSSTAQTQRQQTAAHAVSQETAQVQSPQVPCM